jgi:hypothetical protein
MHITVDIILTNIKAAHTTQPMSTQRLITTYCTITCLLLLRFSDFAPCVGENLTTIRGHPFVLPLSAPSLVSANTSIKIHISIYNPK